MIHSLRQKTIALATVLALVGIGAAPVAAQPNRNAVLSVPVVGSILDTAGAVVASFTGNAAITGFARQGDNVVAVGTLTGVLTRAGQAPTAVVQNFAIPVAVTQATCDILHLDLGPLDLNILGLQIDLSRIVLDITAQAGPGNLLGNLLCAVAGLLDNPNGLANLLNRILGILAGL